MINKILKIRNVGLLQNPTPNRGTELAKVTALYAENGKGKSTFASIMRACQLKDGGRLSARKTIDVVDPPEIKFLRQAGNIIELKDGVWTGNIPPIVVFDSEFVEENVYSGFEVRTDQHQSLLEFALGDQTVQLKQEVDQLTQNIAIQTRERAQAEKALAAYAKPYSVSEFVALQEIPDVKQQIKMFQTKIEAAKNTEQLIKRREPSQIPLIQFDLKSTFSLLQKQIDDLEQKAETVVKSHFTKHTAEGLEDWISRGKNYLTSNFCPFCDQEVSGSDLIQAYQSYFNEAYVELKRDVNLLETKLNTELSDTKINSFVSTLSINNSLIETWNDQLEIASPTFDEQKLRNILKQVREQMLILVSNKSLSPLNSIGSKSDLENLTQAIDEINEIITTYNLEIKVQIDEITEFKKKLGVEDVDNLQVELSRLEASDRRQLPEVLRIVAEYQTAVTERKRLDDGKKIAREELDTLMNSTLDEYQTSINDYLTTFGANFSIEQLKADYRGSGIPRTDYCLELRNKTINLGNREDLANCHSFATALSEADKRTLAFAFFISKLQADSNIANTVVVLDDPVSSLDKDRRHQSIILISSLATECKQLLVLSHDAYFIRELKIKLEENYQNPISPKILTLNRIENDYSGFALCDIDDICSSNYYRHHSLVVDFVDGKPNTNIHDIAKAIRPLLEGYYQRRFPGIIPRRCMFGEIISKAQDATQPNPLAYLKPSLKELREVNEYASQFHHDSNVEVNERTLLIFAKRTLKLIYSNGNI